MLRVETKKTSDSPDLKPIQGPLIRSLDSGRRALYESFVLHEIVCAFN